MTALFSILAGEFALVHSIFRKCLARALFAGVCGFPFALRPSVSSAALLTSDGAVGNLSPAVALGETLSAGVLVMTNKGPRIPSIWGWL